MLVFNISCDFSNTTINTEKVIEIMFKYQAIENSTKLSKSIFDESKYYIVARS